MTRVTRVSVIVTAWLIIGTLTNSIHCALAIDESPITNQSAYLLTNSSAAVAGSYIRVIEQAADATGQAWYLVPQNITRGFIASMSLTFLGDPLAMGEGMSFIISGMDLTSIQNRELLTGSDMALTGLSNFAAVVFDIANGLLSFCTVNSTEIMPPHADWDSYCSKNGVPFKNDTYQVVIMLIPTTLGKAKCNIYIDGYLYSLYDQRDVISSSNNLFYVGFAGASGTNAAELRVISWTLDTTWPCDLNNGNCSEFATCTFSGVIECACKNGFTGNGYTCIVDTSTPFAPNSPAAGTPATQPVDAPSSFNSPPPPTGPPLSTLVPAILIPLAAIVVGAILLAVLLTRRNRHYKNKLKDKDTDLPKYGNVPGVSTTNPVSAEYGRMPEKLDEDGDEPVNAEINPVGIKPSEIDKRMHIPYKSLVFTKEIGAGSFGKVFVGEWRGAEVAIKVNNTVTDMEGFLAEAKLTLGITPHPNLVQTFGVSLDGAYPCIVLEFCGGGSLDTLVFNKESAVSAEKKREYALKTAYGLTHLHNNSIVHRDLAARNILAPESLKDRTYSVKSDVWSYGILLWELVAGQEPHKDEDQLYIGVKIRDEGFTPVIPDDCDPVLREVMQMCWKRDPNERPTMEEIASYLRSH